MAPEGGNSGRAALAGRRSDVSPSLRAKRSNPWPSKRRYRLLRRFASRNDEVKQTSGKPPDQRPQRVERAYHRAPFRPCDGRRRRRSPGQVRVRPRPGLRSASRLGDHWSRPVISPMPAKNTIARMIRASPVITRRQFVLRMRVFPPSQPQEAAGSGVGRDETRAGSCCCNTRHKFRIRRVGKGALAPCPPTTSGTRFGGHASLCPPYNPVNYTGSAIEYFTWLSAKLLSIDAIPSSRVSLVFRNAS